MANQDLIREFIVDVFMPGVQPEQLPLDYDLIASGTIDSLSLLRILTWLEDQFAIPIDDVEITQDNFTSVAAICQFVDHETPNSTARSELTDLEER